MHTSTPPTRSGHRLGLLLAGLLAYTPGLGLAQTPADEQGLASVKADCRIEGEAGGLEGADLDQFVEECVADLLSVEFSNTAE